MPFNATANTYNPVGEDRWSVFDPDKWRNRPQEKAIDTARHYGATTIASMLPEWQGQLADLSPAIDAQRSARRQANTLLTPQGREQQVKSYANNAQRQAYELGRKQAQMLAMQGVQGQGAATQLGAMNDAANATNAYRADMNSPEGLAKLFQMIGQLNDPNAVMSLADFFARMDEQDRPRAMQFLQQEYENSKGGGLGGIIGSVLGMATGGGFQGLGNIFGGGGAKSAAGGALSGLSGLLGGIK